MARVIRSALCVGCNRLLYERLALAVMGFAPLFPPQRHSGLAPQCVEAGRCLARAALRRGPVDAPDPRFAPPFGHAAHLSLPDIAGLPAWASASPHTLRHLPA